MRYLGDYSWKDIDRRVIFGDGISDISGDIRVFPGIPQCGESPAEIEEKTGFPDDYPAEELHNRYEESRYGMNA